MLKGPSSSLRGGTIPAVNTAVKRVKCSEIAEWDNFLVLLVIVISLVC